MLKKTSKSKFCIFTIQHNEDFFLPMWMEYYSQHFDSSDMYIVAHNCTDVVEPVLQKATAAGMNVERIDTDEIFNHDWLLDKVHEMHRRLLEKYEYVVFTDCDELIVHTEMPLRAFLETATEDAYQCCGFDVVEDKMYINEWYHKTLISKVPLQYVWGYHRATPSGVVEQSLHLYHLHKLDYKKAWERKLRLAKEKWNKEAIDGMLSIQNQLTDENEFKKFFYNTEDWLQPVNPMWKTEHSDALKTVLNQIYYKKNQGE